MAHQSHVICCGVTTTNALSEQGKRVSTPDRWSHLPISMDQYQLRRDRCRIEASARGFAGLIVFSRDPDRPGHGTYLANHRPIAGSHPSMYAQRGRGYCAIVIPVDREETLLVTSPYYEPDVTVEQVHVEGRRSWDVPNGAVGQRVGDDGIGRHDRGPGRRRFVVSPPRAPVVKRFVRAVTPRVVVGGCGAWMFFNVERAPAGPVVVRVVVLRVDVCTAPRGTRTIEAIHMDGERSCVSVRRSHVLKRYVHQRTRRPICDLRVRHVRLIPREGGGAARISSDHIWVAI